MKTIKLIDLFIKIANGEDTPNAIKFAGKIFTHNGTGLNSNYYCRETYKILEDSFVFEELNEEVEIIEDTPKKNNIKEILNLNTDYYVEEVYYERLSKEEICLDIQSLKHKINEIIDHLNVEK